MAKVPLKSREDLPEAGQVVFDQIAGTRGRALNVFRALLNSPETASAVAGLGEYIRYNSSLDPAVRETASLATARRRLSSPLDGLDVSLTSTAHCSCPKSSTRWSSCPSEVLK